MTARVHGRPRGRRVALAFVLALVALVSARPAAAVDLNVGGEPLRLDITETVLAAWHLDNMNRTYADDRYGEVQSRLNLGLVYGRWLLNARVDTSGFFNTPSCDANGVCTSPSPPSNVAWWPPIGQGELANRYRFHTIDHLGDMPLPERLALTYQGRSFEVTLGDHYVSFGRGLVLSLRKVDELGSDTDLRGGRVVVREGPLTATLVAGVTNINNVDEATGRTAPDPLDAIVGARTALRLGGVAELAAQGAAIYFHQNELPGQAEGDRALLGSVSLDVPRIPGVGSAYIEIARAERRVALASTPGDAVYAALASYHGRLSVLLEGKYYRDYPFIGTSLKNPSDSFTTIRYNAPPTVERVLADPDAVSPSLNVGGGRVRADYKLSSNVAAFASYAYFYDWTDPSAHLDTHDPYGGVTLAWQQHRSHLSLSGGVRVSQEHPNADPTYPLHPGQVHSLDGHIELVVGQALTRRLSLELGGRHRFREKRIGLDDLAHWQEGEWALGLRWSPTLIVAAGFEYTSEPDLPRPPCCADPVGNPSACFSGQSMCTNYHWLTYPNGQIAWTFRPGSTVRLFVGGQRGGLRCVSGVCRQFPPFEGVKAEAVIRF